MSQIVASISEYGWTNPVLIDENEEVIAGHGSETVYSTETYEAVILSRLGDHPKNTSSLAPLTP